MIEELVQIDEKKLTDAQLIKLQLLGQAADHIIKGKMAEATTKKQKLQSPVVLKANLKENADSSQK